MGTGLAPCGIVSARASVSIASIPLVKSYAMNFCGVKSLREARGAGAKFSSRSVMLLFFTGLNGCGL
jgi:hypothetical protein